MVGSGRSVVAPGWLDAPGAREITARGLAGRRFERSQLCDRSTVDRDDQALPGPPHAQSSAAT